jgi:radical SAM superfamily enzyme YgiQ (UPF0313 family)
MKALFLKPRTGSKTKNVVRDFVYGCWCGGRRIGGMQMPPINDLYCATHARVDGVEVVFMDAELEPARYDELHRGGFAGVAVVSIMTSTQSFQHDVACLSEIKAANPSIKSIMFGSHPTFMPESCLGDKSVDYIVLREPEETIRQLVCAISRGEKTEDLAGIGYRLGNGTIKINALRSFIDMDDLPIPDRSLLPKGIDYFNPVVMKVPYTTMQLSRGCPGQCIFCTAPSFYGRKIRMCSTERAMEELRQIKALGYREVFFRDETFTAYRKRNVELCEAMLREGLGLSWIANARTDMIDRDMMVMMKKAGCHLLKFGVESGSNEMLKTYKKGVTCEHAEEAFRLSNEVGIDTHAHNVLGGPGETLETIEETIRFNLKIKPTTASFGILTPFPGTQLFDDVRKKMGDIGDGTDSNLDNLHVTGFFSEAICGIDGTTLSKKIVEAYRRFYMRPGYLLKRIVSIRSFGEIMRYIVAGSNVLTFSVRGRQ